MCTSLAHNFSPLNIAMSAKLAQQKQAIASESQTNTGLVGVTKPQEQQREKTDAEKKTDIITFIRHGNITLRDIEVFMVALKEREKKITEVARVQSPKNFEVGERVLFSCGPILYIGQINKLNKKSVSLIDTHVYRPETQKNLPIKQYTFDPQGLLCAPGFITHHITREKFEAEKESSIDYVKKHNLKH